MPCKDSKSSFSNLLGVLTWESGIPVPAWEETQSDPVNGIELDHRDLGFNHYSDTCFLLWGWLVLLLVPHL